MFVTSTIEINALTARLLEQNYLYRKLHKTFSIFYRKTSEMIVKYNVVLETLLQQGISEPCLNGELVIKFKITVRTPSVSDQFI